MLHANKSTRFWDDATKDFNIKKVYLWASPDTRGKLETPHDRMQLAFFGTYKTMAYLVVAESLLSYPVNTAWSRTDPLAIVLVKARTSIVTPLHLASGCSVSPSNARSKYKTASPTLYNFLSKTRHALRAARQQ